MNTSSTLKRNLLSLISICLGLMAQPLLAQSPLSGTYTLGGTNPDFATLTEAVDSLNSLGISGSVVFDMRTGTYQEQVILTSVSGASAANTITFRSESGDSSDVIITWFASQEDNYTIKMDSASWFVFESLTFQATNTTYGRVIEMSGGSSHNRFSHNFFDGANVSSTSSLRAIVFADGSFNTLPTESYNRFNHNHFVNGSQAIYFYGNGINPGQEEVGNSFEKNIFENYYSRGLFLAYQDSLNINRNTFANTGGSSSQQAIYLSSGFQFQIIGNKLEQDKSYGIYMANCEGDSMAHSLVANNTISIGGTSTFGYGVYVSRNNFVDFIHNSIHLYGTGSSNYALFYANQGNGEQFLNNIFAYTEAGEGRAYYSNSVIFPDSMDHNDYFSNGPVLAYAGSDISDLAAFRTLSGQDANSVSSNPLFTSSTDFHVNKVTLNAAGAQGTGITTDFEGDPRGVVPDIGADEFTPTGLDVAMTYFEYPTPPFGLGNYTLRAGFTNLTSTPLLSAQVYLEINGVVEPVYNWSGTLAQGQSDTLNLGSFAFSANQSYSLRTWITNPNLGMDVDPGDDSLRVENISTSLAGMYTIGGTTPDFMTFSDAVSSLNGGGVVDTVWFMVRSGTYNEQVVINEFAGGGCNGFPVYFKSESGDSTDVTLEFAANSTANYTLFLNGADHVIFEGIGFTFLDAGYSRLLEVSQGADCNQFLNCLFIGRDINSSSNRYTVIYSSGNTSLDVDNFNIFRNNRIEEGSYGVYWLGYNTLESGNVFEKNTFLGQRSSAINLQYQASAHISYNDITLDSVYNFARGIQVYSSNDSFSIDHNKIFLPSAGVGIYLSGCYGRMNMRGKVYNNFVTVKGDDYASGIQLNSADTLDVAFNNVLVANNPAYGGQAFEDQGRMNIDVRIYNNNFVNTGSGYAILRYGGSTSDYNNYYTKGSYLAQVEGSDIVNLSGFQAATGQDAHAITTDPLYVSESDLHVRKGALDSAGISIAGITKDIDKDVRSNPPDIGSDEFTPMGLDAALVSLAVPQTPFSSGTYPVQVVVKNSGALLLDSATINWSLNGTLQSPIKWYGPLGARQTDTVILGNIMFSDGFFTDIKAWIKQPNGIVDQDASDDTTGVNDIIPSLAGTYTIGGSNFDFLNFTEAFLALQNGGITDTVHFLVRTGTYTEQVNLNSFPGNSCARPVIFQSESGNAADVLVTYAATDFVNSYTIRLNHVNGLHFKNLTFEGTDLSYSRVFIFENGCQCLSWEDNIFKATPGTSTSSSRSLLYGNTSFGEKDSAITIRNNQFRDGAFGIYFYGNDQPELTRDILIQGNVISGQPGGGMEFYGLNNISILNNEISSSQYSFSYMGISLSSLYEGLEIRKNKVSSTEGGYGLYLEYVRIASGPYGQVTNNFISLTGGDENYGIYAYYIDSVKFLHNSVCVKLQDPTYTYAYYGEISEEVYFYNNLLINTGGGYASYIRSGSPPTADYNDLFSNGTNLCYLNGDIPNLAAWITASNMDSNSVSINPVFSIFDDLHLSAGFMDNLGIPVPEVTDDIDGDTRDLTNPDIGADEFSPAADEAGLLRTSAPVRTFAAGNQDIKVILFNNGLNALTSATIDVMVDSIALAPMAWTGNMAPGDSLEVTVGTFNFEIGNPYTVKAWVSLPNGNPDPFAVNDTVRRDSLYPSLAGYYTVGGANPDFMDLDEAIQVLNLSGVAAEVFFNIRPDTIRGQWTLGEITGASDTTRITFQAESGDSTDVVLTFNPTGSADNFIIQLDEGDYFTFKHLTFLAENPSYTQLVNLTNAAQHNYFQNNAFLNLPRNSSSSIYASIYSNGAEMDDMQIRNNYFHSGNFGIYLSNSTTSGLYIHQNRFVEQSYAGVYILSHDSPVISQNDFRSSVNYIWRGVYLYNCTSNYQITQNQIRATQGDYGIYLVSCQSTLLLPGEVTNNYIQLSSVGIATMYGIYHSNCDFVNYSYNTVRLTSRSTNSRGIYLISGSNATLTNNIISTFNRGYAVYSSSTSIITASNYNNLFVETDNVGYFNGAQNSLADWQLASSFDANSFSLDPLFLDDSTFQIRETAFNGSGIPVAGVTVDIEGDPRDALNPDIGADEFEPIFPNDVGIIAITAPKAPFAAGNQNIQVVLRNYGLDTLTSATISWQVNGINQPNYNWTGNLPTSQADTFTLATYNFMAGQSYDLRSWGSNPNGVADTLNTNDTSAVYDLYPALDGIYTVGGINPDFTSLDPAIEALNKGGVLGLVTLNLRAGTYAKQIELGKIIGTNASHGVLIQSENGDSSQVILQTPTGGIAIKLDGTGYITLRGLTIESPNVIASKAIYLTGGTHHTTIENCLLTGRVTTADFFAEAIIYGDATAFNKLKSDITIRNNRFSQGVSGIKMIGYSSSYAENNLEISGNQFIDQTREAIYVDRQQAPVVHANRIQTSSNVNTFIGICMDDCYGAYMVTASHISGLENAKGLYLDGYRGTGTVQGLVANNFIQIGGNDIAHGMESYYTSKLNFFHNTIHITSTDTESGRAWTDLGGTSFTLQNNNFVNDGGGYVLFTNGANSIQNSSYNNYKTSGNTLISRAGTQYSDLVSWRSSTGKDLLSISVDPFFEMTGEPFIRNAKLDSAAAPLTSVPMDIEGEVRDSSFPDMGADEFDLPPADVGVLSLVQPPNGCGLSATETMGVRVANYGSQTQSDFAVAYQIDGGALVVDTVRANIAPGAAYDFTFSQTADLLQRRTYVINAFSNLSGDVNRWNDTMLVVNLVHIQNLAQPVVNMLPADGTAGLDKPLAFSWSPAIGATAYDVYIWADSLAQPGSPTHADISQITVLESAGLSYGIAYKWQVVAKNQCSSRPGPIQQFTMRTLPDLVVDTVQAPPTAFSGQPVNLSWTIKNEGTFTTGATQWIDAVYLSDDAVFDMLSDTYLGGVANFSSLTPGQAYVQNAGFTLPVGIAGNYYLFVLTNAYGAVTEADNTNNFATHITSVMVTLTPPPDLKISSVNAPLTAFSGQNVNLTYVGINEGTGSTTSGGWGDWIYLSPDPVLNPVNATLLGKRRFTGTLGVNNTYSKSGDFLLPQGIFGTYYFHVVTDALQEEFEFVFETNNTTASDTCRIFLTPPTDLVVNSIGPIPDLDADADFVFRYTLKNIGGSAPNTTWQDRIYLSSDSVFDPNSDTPLLIRNINANLGPGDSITFFPRVHIPFGLTGPHHIFVQTDRRDDVYEYSFENNNVTGSNQFNIINPDLVITQLFNPDSATTGQLISLNWDDKNQGPGNLFFHRWKDDIGISRYPVYDPDSTMEWAIVSASGVLAPGDSSHRGLTMTVPNGLSGDYYVYVEADRNDRIFEAGNENNNVTRGANKLHINLSPWPDLIVRNIQLPDTIRAGDTVPMKFTIVNQGLASTFGSGFKTKAFFQVDSAWNPVQAKEIASIDYSRVLEPGDSIQFTVNVSMPMLSLVVAGLDSFTTAPVFIHVDERDAIYEHTDENNNRVRSDSFYIFCPPPVDLLIDDADFPFTNLNSGGAATVSWSVENISSTTAYWNYPFWYDGIFLSRDTIWDGFNDVFVTDWVRPGPLGMNQGYQDARTFNLLNGLSGDYYVFMVTDHTNLNRDGNPDNNAWLMRDMMGQPKVLHVTLSPYPDLEPTLFIAPQTAAAGQPIEIDYRVQNRGVGPTQAGSWTDQVYLSTDFVIDPGDTILGTNVYNSILGVGQAYRDTMSITLPATASGNYVLLFKTDVNNVLYEHQAENNNEAFAYLVVYRPPPSDLVITRITVPDSMIAGDTATIRWTLRNVGNNPATGIMTDAVYLSEDTIWDVSDPLFGLLQNNINLAPQGMTERSLNKNATGLEIGDYHVIVRTDILDNIIEQNDTNNLAYSPDQIRVTVEELPLNVLKSNQLCDNIELYYRIEIPANLIGETLLIDLKADSVNGSNELYLRKSAVPNRVTYDYTSILPQQNGNQQLVVPSLQAGTYYLMAYGNTSNGNKQNAEFYARILNFEIRAVNASMGGNTGSVTVKIDGAKFNPAIRIQLEDSGRVYLASSVYYVDPISVFATFNLRGAPLGLYDVVGILAGDTARLVDAFEVITGDAGSDGGAMGGAGSGGNGGNGGGGSGGISCTVENVGYDNLLITTITHPATSRLGRIVPITIHYGNQGNVDIPVPFRFLISLEGAPLAFDVNDLNPGQLELILEFSEANGPPGVLRPGATGSVTVYTQARAPLRFRLLR